jgi:LPXTG-motif cell wall-anchored protein
MIRNLIAAVAFVAVATVGWPQVGFDAARTGFNPAEVQLTTATVTTLTRSWSASVGVPTTTPVAFGGDVYIGAGGAATSFVGASGTQRWHKPFVNNASSSVGQLTVIGAGLSAPVGNGFANGSATFDASTGAVSNSQVAIHEFRGPLVHRADVDAYVTGGFGSGGPVIVLVSYGASSGVVHSGSELETLPWVGPTIVGRHVLVGYGTDMLSFSLDACPPVDGMAAISCAPEWTAPLAALPQAATGMDDDHVAVATADGDVAVLNLTDGSRAWTGLTGSSGLTAPAVAQGSFFVGAADGTVYAFPAAGCGAATCSATFSVATGGAAISDQPAVGADVVYVGNASGQVFAFASAGCGTPACPTLWTASVDDTPSPGSVRGPIVADGTLYAATSTGSLAAFGLPGSTTTTTSTSTSTSTSSTSTSTSTVLAGTTTTTPGPPPVLTVSPSSAVPGAAVSVTSTGWSPGAAIAVSLHSDPIPLTTLVADPTEHVSGTVIVPFTATIGAHQVVLTGIGANGQGRTVSTNFTVLAPFQTTSTSIAAGTLPVTGTDARSLLVIGVVLTSVGAAILVLRRRVSTGR